jgi:outer membrane protein assembly factor BamB
VARVSSDGTQEAVQATPAIAQDDTIYLVALDSKLYAINPDGTEKWRFTACCGWVSSVAIGADGTVYAANDRLYAFTGPSTRPPCHQFRMACEWFPDRKAQSRVSG